MDVPQSIVDACKKGDPLAFEELVRLTHKDVYALSLRLLGNPDDAAESTQDTYLKLLRTIRSFRGESKFSTWLYRVTSSVAISSLRKRAKRQMDVPLEVADWQSIPGSVEPSVEAERRMLKDRLDRALLTLPPGYRAVVVLKDIYGFSLAEIGKQLGITEGAAKVRLFRARQRLKDKLYEDGPARFRSKRKAVDGSP